MIRDGAADSTPAEAAPPRRPSIAHNLIANLAGKAWTSAMGLLFIPAYVRLMGIESFGLIGVFASVTALISILDLGLSPTLSRELARLSAVAARETSREARDLVRTLEIVFWATGVVICIGLIVAAPLLARHWITAPTLGHETVWRAFALMGVIIAVQWPSSVYDGGLTGLQNQVRLNLVRIVMVTVQNVGALLVLSFVSPSILAYFTWQVIVAVAQTLALRTSLWACMPTGPGPALRFELLRKHSRFAAGMTGITLTSIILTQADKIVLSKFVPLDTFGYYTLASTVAYALTFVVMPFFSALFPRFSQLFAGEVDETELSQLYHRSAQFVAALVLPAAAVLTLFSDKLLFLWTGNPEIVAHTAPLARLLAVGSCLNALMFVPYLLQVSSGWTRLAVVKNIVAIAILVPLLTWGVSRYGATAGALAWIALNLGYVIFEIPLMHRRLLAREMWRWYLGDLMLPAMVVLAISLLSRALFPASAGALHTLAWLVGTGTAALLASSIVMVHTRSWLVQQVRFP